MTERRWQRVVFSAECDEDGNCPICGIDFGDCGCPGPTMDDYEYTEKNGVLWGRPMVTNAQAARTRRS